MLRTRRRNKREDTRAGCTCLQTLELLFLSDKLLDDVKHILLWWLTTDGLYFLQAICAEGVETYTILCILNMFCQFGLEQDQFFL